MKKTLRQRIFFSIVGIVFGEGLWEFSGPVGNGKPVTFNQFVYNITCKQIARWHEKSLGSEHKEKIYNKVCTRKSFM